MLRFRQKLLCFFDDPKKSCKLKFVKHCEEQLTRIDEHLDSGDFTCDLFYLNIPDLIVGGRI